MFEYPAVCIICGDQSPYVVPKVRVEAPPQNPGGMLGLIHRHIERARQYYDEYYAQHEGEENVRHPPFPPAEGLPQQREERVGEGPREDGGLDEIHRGLMEALRNVIARPAPQTQGQQDSSSSSGDEAAT